MNNSELLAKQLKNLKIDFASVGPYEHVKSGWACCAYDTSSNEYLVELKASKASTIDLINPLSINVI
jgi:hypothetical protein